MLINEKLSILYRDWQQTHPGHFVAGGVVDEDMYEGSDAKILFLFKEVNDTAQQENWSLVQLMHDHQQLKILPDLGDSRGMDFRDATGLPTL